VIFSPRIRTRAARSGRSRRPRATFRQVLARIPALLWIIVIFILLTLPASDVPSIYFWTFGIDFDKFIHGVLFFVQSALLWYAFIAGGFNPKRIPHPLFSAALLSTLYGAAMEVYQGTLIDRSADVMDGVADAIGATLFVVVAVSGLRVAVMKRLKARQSAGE